MSDITREQVEHLAGLARIALTADEIDTMTRELGQIVDNVAKVAEVASARKLDAKLLARFAVAPADPWPTVADAEAFLDMALAVQVAADRGDIDEQTCSTNNDADGSTPTASSVWSSV